MSYTDGFEDGFGAGNAAIKMNLFLLTLEENNVVKQFLHQTLAGVQKRIASWWPEFVDWLDDTIVVGKDGSKVTFPTPSPNLHDIETLFLEENGSSGATLTVIDFITESRNSMVITLKFIVVEE
jgi:hypothetical protein